MQFHRTLTILSAALAGAIIAGTTASAQTELVYGNWTPPREYQNVQAMPYIFQQIEKETNGAIKWKLIAGGQLADGKATWTAVKDGLMQAGLGIATYVPNTVPSLYMIYSTLVFGHNDVVAATGAAMEVFYLRCPTCLEDFRKINSVPLGGWTSSAYLLACREPVKTVADLKGKRIRATGGNAELFKLAGAVPVGATLVEAVGLLQRGGLDCQHGIADWLRTFGYADFAKNIVDYPLGLSGPAIGFVLNRDTWNKFTPDQKKIHIKYAAWMSAKLAIGNFLIANEEGLQSVIKDKGVQMIKVDAKEWDAVPAAYKKTEREKNVATGKEFGVKDPGAIIDDYEKTIVKWRGLSKEVGRDIDKFTEVLMREIYSKIDPSKL
ncbi:MAG: TRAP transporter substrate-binding protein DctP [Xanthobacteraceae bacterium]